MKIKILLLALLMPVFLIAQNYEQQGDELFQQAKYEQAVKKYDAAMVTSETGNAQLRLKKENAKKCAALLQKAVSAESSKHYSEAEKAYSELFALHALPKYQKKVAECKGFVQKEALAKKERERSYENGHFAVDMGLSVRWADCNVGASNSFEVGNYYAWGETSPKPSYAWKSYKYFSNDKLQKYCACSDCGKVDNRLVLEPIDDAASANWGGTWRTPTKEQWEELADDKNCRWEWKEKSGVQGYVVTSKITRNSIFLPVTGYKPSGTKIEHPELGLYWTSTLFTKKYMDGYLAAYRFDLGSQHYNCRGTHRCNGRAIRAVCK